MNTQNTQEKKYIESPPDNDSNYEDMDRGPEEIDPINHPRNYEIDPSDESDSEK